VSEIRTKKELSVKTTVYFTESEIANLCVNQAFKMAEVASGEWKTDWEFDEYSSGGIRGITITFTRQEEIG
jgi:hypothetical protein